MVPLEHDKIRDIRDSDQEVGLYSFLFISNWEIPPATEQRGFKGYAEGPNSSSLVVMGLNA